VATDQDFDDFTVTTERKPIAGVVAGEIPEKLSEHMARETPNVLKSVDHELILTAKTEEQAKRLAGYARAWGARQEPALYIKKIGNGSRYPAHVARLSVKLADEVTADHRPGRKNPSDTPDTPAPAEAGKGK